MRIRYAADTDLERCQQIARQHAKWLPFVMRAQLADRAARRELFVAEVDGQVLGFASWHARRDGWNVVYDLAVDRDYQGQGIGRALLYAVPRPVRLKVTEDNPANAFYRNSGMALVGQETGRKRALNVWERRG